MKSYREFRGRGIDLKMSLLAAKILFDGISCVKQSRINEILASETMQENTTLNDFFAVAEINEALHLAGTQLLSVEIGKGIHSLF